MLGTFMDAQASHMLGGSLRYRYVSGNSYEATFTLYRDCSGSTAPPDLTLTLRSATYGQTSFYILTPKPGTGTELLQACSSSLTACSGGSLPGIQVWEYTALVSVPAVCPDWIFSISNCCRSTSINTLSDPSNESMYLEALLNNTAGPNSSAVPALAPQFVLPLGQDAVLNPAATDADHDSLVYSISAPQNGPSQNVGFRSPYSADHLMDGQPALRVDPVTGTVTVHPTHIECAVYALRIDEYRNGMLTGTQTVDQEVLIHALNNNLPSLTTSGNSFNLTVCAGSMLRLGLFASDSDAGQTTYVEFVGDHSGMSLSRVSSGEFQLQFISGNDAGSEHTAFLKVQDNACPYPGLRIYPLHIRVKPSPVAQLVSVHHATCPNTHDGSAEITAGGGTALTYSWTPNAGSSERINDLDPGNYTAQIQNAEGCQSQLTLTVQSAHPAPTVTLSPETDLCAGKSVVLSAGPAGQDYQWSNGGSAATVTVASAGTYSVVVRNEWGCETTASSVVKVMQCANEDGTILSIYPNPFRDQVNISLGSAELQGISITVCDLSGRIVKQLDDMTLTNETIGVDLSDLRSGTYLLNVHTATLSEVRRLVKQ